MYQEYFGFRVLPFASAPDPKIFYLNPVYQAALGTLRYGVLAKKGLIVLTGAVGTGKTALLRKLFDDLGSTVRPIWVVNSRTSFASILRIILAELDAKPESNELSAMIDELHNVLLRNANRDIVTCLIIEETQRLDGQTLEGLRQLCNFEADGQKLLQLILVGQPQFMKKLDEPEHHSLKQRVALHCRLFAFTRSELDRYIEFQLQAAGYQGARLFDAGAIARIAQYSGGIPRLVNTICDNALLAACRSSRAEVSQALIDEVANDMGLVTDPPASAAMPRDEVSWVSRIQPPADQQSDDVKRESRPERAPARRAETAPPQRRAARMFSAALLALIPLGGAGWALYFNDDVPFLEYFKSQGQVVSSRLAQPAATAEKQVEKPSPMQQATVTEDGSEVGEGDHAEPAAPAETEKSPVLEPSVPAPRKIEYPKDDQEDTREVSRQARSVSRQGSVKDPAVERRLLEIAVQKAIRNRAIEGVSVRLVDGTVYLDGLVASERQRSLAERAARGVRNVVRVRNQIKIRP